MTIKRELKLIALSAIFLLFIAGCDGKEAPTGAPTTPFLGGSVGLEINFLEGNPPAEVTDSNTFPFQAIVTLKNVGEHDVARDKIKVSLIGFLPSQFNPASPDNFDETKLKDQTLLEDLSGRKRDADGNIIEPVEVFFTFPDKDASSKNFNFKDQIAGNNIFVFRADACYKYQTRVKSDICILQSQNVAGSNKLQLSFDVEHSGSGKVFDPIPAANCPRDSAGRRATEDQAIVNVDTGLAIASYQLKCVGLSDVAGATTAKQSGNVKLINGKRTITCTLDMPTTRTDFIKPVDITVEFNYAQNVDKEILVKHILTNP